jgi:hypothetical protein
MEKLHNVFNEISGDGDDKETVSTLACQTSSTLMKNNMPVTK